jgi:hypothetical protein
MVKDSLKMIKAVLLIIAFFALHSKNAQIVMGKVLLEEGPYYKLPASSI